MTSSAPSSVLPGSKGWPSVLRAYVQLLMLGVSVAAFIALSSAYWRMDGHDRALPWNWYLAPAQLTSMDGQHTAARDFCQVVSWVNSSRHIDCSRDFVRAGAVCFGNPSAVLCDNGATLVATCFWLALIFCSGLILRLLKRPTIESSTAAERHQSWQQVFTAGMTGMLAMIWAYHSINVTDYWLGGCVTAPDKCGIDLSLGAPQFLMQLAFAISFLVPAAEGAYRARHDFFQKYESEDAREAGQ